MAKWNVNLSGCIEASNGEDAKERLFDLYDQLLAGKDVQELLVEDENFDFSVGFSGYGD